MSPVPARPSIYHITHIDNLVQIANDGCLYSDRIMLDRGGATIVGMASIKARRLRLPVRCHAGDSVGDYVPFYFCPRSVMLYLIHMGNHPELTYRGGQVPILHLEADLHAVVRWAQSQRRRWAFTLSNAGANYTEFRKQLDQLNEINWDAVEAQDWRDSDLREGKQAEFLLNESFPFELITRIGVISEAMRTRVRDALRATPYKPNVEVIRSWYY
jgi:ssDNA thymidine ADP-ribosyltransferase, DarT